MKRNSSVLLTEDVKHIAKLAKLPLTAEEIDVLRRQLAETLNYIKVLKSINTDNIIPTSHVGGLVNRFRDDEIIPSLKQEEALQNSKNVRNMMFKVKAIFNE